VDHATLKEGTGDATGCKSAAVNGPIHIP
jgi:hypothetical protein